MMEQKHITCDVICNNCGESCLVENINGVLQFEYAVLSAQWGYWSNNDGLEEEAHLCEKCWSKIVSKFLLETGKVNHF